MDLRGSQDTPESDSTCSSSFLPGDGGSILGLGGTCAGVSAAESTKESKHLEVPPFLFRLSKPKPESADFTPLEGLLRVFRTPESWLLTEAHAQIPKKGRGLNSCASEQTAYPCDGAFLAERNNRPVMLRVLFMLFCLIISVISIVYLLNNLDIHLCTEHKYEITTNTGAVFVNVRD